MRKKKKTHEYFCHVIINFRRQFTENIFPSVTNNFLLLLNLMSWRLWTPESHLPLSLTVLAEHRNVCCKVSPVCRWQDQLVDSSSGLVFSLSLCHWTQCWVMMCEDARPASQSSRGVPYYTLDHTSALSLWVWNSKPWTGKARVLLRGHILAPCSSTKEMAVL